MTLSIKIVNRAPEDGQTARVSTYDTVDGKKADEPAGVMRVKPGEELEILLHAGRHIEVHEVNENGQTADEVNLAKRLAKAESLTPTPAPDPHPGEKQGIRKPRQK